jgi:type II secretory pathway pseudopilin PulG
MALVLIASSAVVLTSMRTQRRRQREEDLIWRGEQYERAIRLYYRKTGHYPQKIEDLISGVPDIHFLRQAYQDPMNSIDGSWRLIYVNAAGQIIGSVRYATLQQMAILEMNGGTLPGAPSASGSSFWDTSPAGAQPSGTSSSLSGTSQNTSSDQSGQNALSSPQSNAAASNPSSAFGPSSGSSNMSGQPANPLTLLQPTGPVSGPVIGGMITGVASSVDTPSLKVYKGGKKYIEWEFIWNPIEEQARANQQVMQQTGSQAGQPGNTGNSILGPIGGSVPGNPGGATQPQQP